MVYSDFNWEFLKVFEFNLYKKFLMLTGFFLTTNIDIKNKVNSFLWRFLVFSKVIKVTLGHPLIKLLYLHTQYLKNRQ